MAAPHGGGGAGAGDSSKQGGYTMRSCCVGRRFFFFVFFLLLCFYSFSFSLSLLFSYLLFRSLSLFSVSVSLFLLFFFPPMFSPGSFSFLCLFLPLSLVFFHFVLCFSSHFLCFCCSSSFFQNPSSKFSPF